MTTTDMIVLVLNSGSSSIKYRLFDMTSETVVARGMIERIGLSDSLFTLQAAGNEIAGASVEVPDHVVGLRILTDALTDSGHSILSDLHEIDAVGHRVVHGGEEFGNSVLITDAVVKAIEACVGLAPLHNPANLSGIYACRELMPDTPQVAVFDTAFHQTMPPHAFLYALPYDYYSSYGVRRYGFHGTSHQYVAEEAARLLCRPMADMKMITCHLGNGSSVTAIREGRSVDTSMGLTPLEGLPMGTRSGDLDPAIFPFLIQRMGCSVQELSDILNKKSGLLGLSGVSSDVRDLRRAAADGNERAKVALGVFAYRVKKRIGSYAAALGGLDALVFTAGIGENDAQLRSEVCSEMGFLGLTLDHTRNEASGHEARDISAEESRVRVLVVPTNEELAIAAETHRIMQHVDQPRTSQVGRKEAD